MTQTGLEKAKPDGKSAPSTKTKGKRSHLRFSLGTLLILALLSAALIGLNADRREHVAFTVNPSGTYDAIRFTCYGWPLRARWTMEPLGPVSADFAEKVLKMGVVGMSEAGQEREYKAEEYTSDLERATYHEGVRMFLNLAIATLVLTGVGIQSERIIRRRGSRPSGSTGCQAAHRKQDPQTMAASGTTSDSSTG